MKYLPVVPLSGPLEAWLPSVQDALINTSGVFSISELKEEIDWDQACKISKKILKVYMMATQHNVYQLHTGLDLEKGQGKSSSRLSKQKCVHSWEPHMNKGLFDVIIATRDQLRPLQICGGGGQFYSIFDLTSVSTGAFLAIVIPGYTLQVFDQKIPAAMYRRVRREDGDTPAARQIFRCRLKPEFELNGQEIGVTLIQTFHKSVMGVFNVKYRDVAGRSGVIVATPGMTVQDIKVAYQDAEGVPTDQIRLVHAGVQLENDGLSLADYNIV